MGNKHYKNFSFSPDQSYNVEFKFVPSNYNELSGKCDAHFYYKDKSLITIVQNVNPRENVIWFSDFAILDGYGPHRSRKILVDLKHGFTKEIPSIGSFDFIGKSNEKAYS